MKHIFIVNIVWDINVNTIHYKHGQNWTNLTCINFIVVFYMDWGSNVFFCNIQVLVSLHGQLDIIIDV
jgi:hypothetical protein